MATVTEYEQQRAIEFLKLSNMLITNANIEQAAMTIYASLEYIHEEDELSLTLAVFEAIAAVDEFRIVQWPLVKPDTLGTYWEQLRKLNLVRWWASQKLQAKRMKHHEKR